MTRRRWERLFWAAALGLALGGWARWRRAVPEARSPDFPALAAPSPVRPAAPARLASAADAVARGNPFRLDRAPAPLGTPRAGQLGGAGSPYPPGGSYPAYTPPGGSYPSYSPAGGAPSYSGGPQLRVTGISGPPWEALMEGLPERQGAVVVREGDRFGGLRIRSISQDLVVVQGPDGTRRLQIQRTGP
ncbi:MAG: hypothetical protein AVDCRST_MAG68-5176 [uncultured Gemmatimonadetes bacterium]|uniref:Uncharacterized protein n=1 Tax=uncultured Gemmatimonadota bacterium TaxID=203437 RepID=A0A6J4MVA3_9BACT|nr:MAG: hypothetical protein AVDCRST_MAG68-5176 [uncultured Gemmatimonadota bacterium]